MIDCDDAERDSQLQIDATLCLAEVQESIGLYQKAINNYVAVLTQDPSNQKALDGQDRANVKLMNKYKSEEDDQSQEISRSISPI